MKFLTIWTMPWKAMSLRERLSRTKEWLAMTVASHLPKQVKYWVVMLVVGKITTTPPFDKQHPMSLTTEDVLKNLEHAV